MQSAHGHRQCSVCSKTLNVHQVVRGGICDSTSCRATAAKRSIVRQYAEQKALQESIARKHLPSLLANSHLSEADIALIALPGSVAPLRPPPPERRERFRESVTAAVAASSTPDHEAMQPIPEADSAPPAATPNAACGACRGLCCRNGGDKAYVDDSTVQRVRALRPGLSDADIIALYMNAIPERIVENSCILHGEQGCALPRELRSNVCNNFYCRPVRDWEREAVRTGTRPTAIFVLHDDQVIRSTLVSE